MVQVDNNFNYVIPEGDDTEIKVQIDCKCFITKKKCFYPMSVWTEIWEGRSLEDVKKEAIKDYEKSYEKVEIGAVYVNEEAIDLINQYKQNKEVLKN